MKWNEINLKPLEGFVQVLTFGAEKYAEDNWKAVPDLRKRYYSALMRHLISWKNGNTIDEESGLNHLHHCLCNAYFLAYADYGLERTIFVENSKPIELVPKFGQIFTDKNNKQIGQKDDKQKPKWHLVNLNVIKEIYDKQFVPSTFSKTISYYDCIFESLSKYDVHKDNPIELMANVFVSLVELLNYEV